MKPLVISDPSLIIALQDEIRRSEDSRYDHRLHAVLLVAQGQSCRQVAAALGDSSRIVQYWVNQFESRGFVGLQEGQRPGRPRLLSAKQLSKTEQALRKTPGDFGLTGGIWDGKTLSAFISRKFNITVGVRQCQRMFRHFGFRLRKPRPMIAHSDGGKRKDFKKKALATGKK